MSTEITCPTCGTVSHFEEIEREASAFCRVCDYPLFWVRSARLATSDISNGDAGLRRLPGAVGRTALATFACPACTEPNLLNAVICIRCGAELHPAPAPPPPAPPPPPPPPPVVVVPPPAPPKSRIWPWVVLGLLGVLAIVLILAFTL